VHLINESETGLRFGETCLTPLSLAVWCVSC